VDELLQDNTDEQLLKDADYKEELIAGLEEKKGTKRAATETKAHSKIEKVKADLEKLQHKKELEESEEDEDAPKKKKSKKSSNKEDAGEEIAAEDREVAEIFAFYQKMKVDELKDVLR